MYIYIYIYIYIHIYIYIYSFFLELVSLGVKTSQRKIATGRYPRRKRCNGATAKIQYSGCLLRRAGTSFTSFAKGRFFSRDADTNGRVQFPRSANRCRYSCHFQRERPTHMHALCVMCGRGAVRPVSEQLGYRSMNIEHAENQSVRAIITSWLPRAEVSRWRIANLYRDKHVVDATARVLYNARSTQIYAIGS